MKTHQELVPTTLLSEVGRYAATRQTFEHILPQLHLLSWFLRQGIKAVFHLASLMYALYSVVGIERRHVECSQLNCLEIDEVFVAKAVEQ